MKKLLVFLVYMALFYAGCSQDFIEKIEIKKKTYASQMMGTFVNKTLENNCTYFTLAKQTKKKYKVGMHKKLTKGTWILEMYKNPPEHDYWKIEYLDLLPKSPFSNLPLL